MLQLSHPDYTFEQTLEVCRQGIIGNAALLQKVDNENQELQKLGVDYNELASTGGLYNIKAIPKRPNYDPLVVGQLKKSDLVKLYNTYFVESKKPGRAVYNALMVAANEKCPFCGGIGRPRNLDHYLPKAHYPQFSVLPSNLVPSCRDCNMDGKGDGYATSAGQQILHPYLDDRRFFEEQWLFASYHADQYGKPGSIEYFVRAPENWTNTQKQRVQKHFEDFDLGLRFSKEAGARHITYLAQIQILTKEHFSCEEAKSVILQPAIDSAPFVNHWEALIVPGFDGI